MTLLAACASAVPSATVAPTSAPIAPAEPTPIPTPAIILPEITSVEIDRPELPRYESLEMTVGVEADYNNPYDLGEVKLDGLFSAPDGTQMNVPGFWDGDESSWRVRFTPSQAGQWRYQLAITDGRGKSLPAEGTFNVTESDHHGWLQVGSWVDPELSSRYFTYHDGTPFYGLGYCEALNILFDGFDVDSGVGLFNTMNETGANFVVWWPLYTYSPIKSDYADYSASNMQTIDLVVADAQKKGIFLIFTVWDHLQLRSTDHPWGAGNWDNNNGFRKLGSINSFFTSDEAWAWQENFYRYLIARWGYSPAIGMWQTVSEINGTQAFEQADPWHEKVDAYFEANDPYRHPTTASQSGDVEWPDGHAVMDSPQVHLYDFKNEAVGAASVLVHWTTLMWDLEPKPNWVGEFGVQGNAYYPELYHNSIWAALASGAAMTPAEWNSGGSWAHMTDEMNADLAHLGRFVADLPLAQLNPSALQLSSRDEQVRAWGLAGEGGGLIWVQDFALEGQPIDVVRSSEAIRSGVTLDVEGLVSGRYSVHPYDTWQGMYLDTFEITCAEGQACAIPLPDFKADMALRLEGQ